MINLLTETRTAETTSGARVNVNIQLHPEEKRVMVIFDEIVEAHAQAWVDHVAKNNEPEGAEASFRQGMIDEYFKRVSEFYSEGDKVFDLAMEILEKDLTWNLAIAEAHGIDELPEKLRFLLKTGRIQKRG